jgi:hypothetical protein
VTVPYYPIIPYYPLLSPMVFVGITSFAWNCRVGRGTSPTTNSSHPTLYASASHVFAASISAASK